MSATSISEEYFAILNAQYKLVKSTEFVKNGDTSDEAIKEFIATLEYSPAIYNVMHSTAALLVRAMYLTDPDQFRNLLSGKLAFLSLVIGDGDTLARSLRVANFATIDLSSQRVSVSILPQHVKKAHIHKRAHQERPVETEKGNSSSNKKRIHNSYTNTYIQKKPHERNTRLVNSSAMPDDHINHLIDRVVVRAKKEENEKEENEKDTSTSVCISNASEPTIWGDC